MTSPLLTEPPGRPDQPRPEPGQILIVIHDFTARSSDELSLSKGDRVELIERDDDFGDGWYLGRHLTNGASGLFPEVYTRIAPRGPPSYPPTNSTTPRAQPIALDAPKADPVLPDIGSVVGDTSTKDATSTSNAEADTTPEASRRASTSDPLVASNTPPFTTSGTTDPDKPAKVPTISTSQPIPPKNVTAAKSHAHGQDSPVMNETLSVIDEHITDMNSPHQGSLAPERRGANDSGSEYSSHIGHRLSYINGEETDEEEEMMHTKEEVDTWNPDQVAEYLFAAGVETKHCEVFRDQEITGDVLLGMDQTSVFLKEFDLGSVGRRLKTWQKIKALQDEVNGETSTRRNTGTYGSDAGSEDAHRSRSRSINSSSILPRIPSLMERTETRQNSHFLQQRNEISSPSMTSPKVIQENPRATAEKRPSAASIRDINHSRHSSANEFSASIAAAIAADSPQFTQDGFHKKQPSFDRNWTMGPAASPPVPARPLSSSNINAVARSSTDHLSSSTPPSTNLDTLDRGYFSGGEADGRSRNVLRKRGNSATHSRNSSYTDEQRVRSATAHTRHSRFGSVDSIRDAPPSATQKYYGLPINGRRRTPSENSINAPPRPPPPPKDVPSPTVSTLGGGSYAATTPTSPKKGHPSDWLLPVGRSSSIKKKNFGLRAISDAVTGNEKARLTSPTDSLPQSVKESPIQSPSRTTTTTSSSPSGGPSFDLDSPDAKSASTMPTTPGSARTTRKKSKKNTSAYTRGLEKKTPQEAMAGADYSGWMKKKSTNLMTTWKPRLFILKGRRLSYYYSETDEQEKGLIDISFHRVLPADSDRLTGLHATLTGAITSPTSASAAQAPTMASAEAAAEPESTLKPSGAESIFIFKLVPPRAGLSRAVTFTKPTVHYFAVPNIKQGRLWMAALMKATIDRDDSKAITTTYQQKTISLAKARAMRHRPPALMNLDEHVEEEAMKTPASDRNGLNIRGIVYDHDSQEGDSGVSGVEKGSLEKTQVAGANGTNGFKGSSGPQTA